METVPKNIELLFKETPQNFNADLASKKIFKNVKKPKKKPPFPSTIKHKICDKCLKSINKFSLKWTLKKEHGFKNLCVVCEADILKALKPKCDNCKLINNKLQCKIGGHINAILNYFGFNELCKKCFPILKKKYMKETTTND